jgi:hypothetical protein
MRFRSHGLRRLVSCCLVTAEENGPLMNRLSQFCTLAAILVALSSCNTMSDLVTSKLPESHSGRPTIVVSLRKQEAYIYRAGYITASSRISSGREGYRTPTGRFQVIRKDEDHRSSVYGDYVDDSGRIVKVNVDSTACPLRRRPDALFSRILAGLRIAPGLPAGGACIARMH